MKKGVKLIILLLVMALAIGGLIAVSRYNAKQEEIDSAQTAEVTAFTVNTADVTAIRFVNDGTDITLTKGADGTWYYEGDKTLPLDQAVPEGILNTVASVTATALITETPTDLAQYELTDAPCTVTLTDKSKGDITLKIGMASPSGDLYFRSSLSEAVYTVSTDLLAAFSRTTNDLVEIEKVPTFDSIDSVEIKGKDSAFTITAEPKKEDDTQASYSVLIDNSGLLLTEENAAALESEINGLSFTECVSYQGNTEDYGLDKPAYEITVNYTAGNEKGTFTLLLGNTNEDGTLYYAMLKGSKRIYTVYLENVNTLTVADPFTLCAEADTDVN